MIVRMSNWKRKHVVIVGAGLVGSTFAYTLAQSGIADDIALIDHNQELAKGQVLDLIQGLPFLPTIDIRTGTPADYRNAHVIVITAGSKQQSGESRLNLLKRNATIIEGIVREIVDQGSQAVILVVSNPVDILTYVALKKSRWAQGRVIGSGTVLDNARFRYLLSRHCSIDVHNVHAYILGEHGDSEFAAWSMSHIAGMPIDRYCNVCHKCTDWKAECQRIADEVKKSAYHIIDYKGSTYYAIGLALVQIVAAIIQNQRRVLTVSTFLNGEYGIKDVCLGVPCIVSQYGMDQVIEGNLTPEELQLLSRSANVLKKSLREMNAG
jgi:L-lactate dehydrogenase